ncbi:hypothetical protein AB0N65_00290 [Paenarthrobacter sp. NPDC089322]|uniref:hypothetical protein n=1 Tax=Paenarthrobacter sp. NPDC089322 TaxID=3155065 RepID=UPI003425E419
MNMRLFRGLLIAVLVGTVSTTPVASPAPVPPRVEETMRPADRMVNLGFEDVVRSDPRYLDELAARLEAVDATAVSISVGRTDWTAFPWSGQVRTDSSQVTDTGQDFVAGAISKLGVAANGKRRDIVLTIDVLLERALQEDPSLAGISATGAKSSSFASVSALRRGEAGNKLAALAAEVAKRYRPTAVDLTELMFDGFAFGTDDLVDFKATTGEPDWPRLDNGSIDQSDPHLRTWKCEAVADIVRKVSAAVEPFGVRVEMDVRSPRKTAAGDRAESGHDYELLLKQLDRLHVWQYVGLNGRRAPGTQELVRALNERAKDRLSLSLGLWSEDGTISAETFAANLEEAELGGATSVSVTPASLMNDAHWEVLKHAWAE